VRGIVWSAVVAAGCCVAAVIVAALGGSRDLVLAVGLSGVVAALLNMQK
jgi:hypothetical protein